MILFIIDTIIIGFSGITCILFFYWTICFMIHIHLTSTGLIDSSKSLLKKYIPKGKCRERIKDMYEFMIHKKYGHGSYTSSTSMSPSLYNIFEKIPSSHSNSQL